MLVALHVIVQYGFSLTMRCSTHGQGFSQDLETGCPDLDIVNCLGIHIFKETIIYSDSYHKYVFTYS